MHNQSANYTSKAAKGSWEHIVWVTGPGWSWQIDCVINSFTLLFSSHVYSLEFVSIKKNPGDGKLNFLFLCCPAKLAQFGQLWIMMIMIMDLR